MKEQINKILEAIDHQVLARLTPSGAVASDIGHVTSFLFHRLFDSRDVPASIYPHEQVTVSHFEAFLQACQRRGLAFLTPEDVLQGRHLGRRSVMITFDDGYADNLRALPLLEKYCARATFFVAPAHIAEQRRFWCDVVWSQGDHDLHRYQVLPHEQAIAEIETRWPGALKDITDADRPMTEAEFLALANSPHVEIGHHSYNHTVLSPRSDAFVQEEIRLANQFFQQRLGKSPVAIAYPNGVYSDTLVRQCADLGFRFGFTCEPRTEVLSDKPDPQQLLRLGRYSISGLRAVDSQLSSATLRFSAKTSVYDFKRRINRISRSRRTDQIYEY